MTIPVKGLFELDSYTVEHSRVQLAPNITRPKCCYPHSVSTVVTELEQVQCSGRHGVEFRKSVWTIL